MQNNLVAIFESPIHGKGGYATEDIPTGTRIIEYVGELISAAEGTKRMNSDKDGKANVYIFSLDDQHDIDGNVDYNIARFINHSCIPNSKYEKLNGHIWIVSLRPIKKGEEITFNYDYDLENYQQYPCRCNSPGCVGYMLDEKFWPIIKK